MFVRNAVWAMHFWAIFQETCSIHNFGDAPLKNIIETVDKTKKWKVIWWKLSGKTKQLLWETLERNLWRLRIIWQHFWSSAEWSYVFGKKLLEIILDNLRQQLCWIIRTGLDNGPFATLSELQTHPNLHSPIWVGRKEMTQIEHTRICSLTAGQDQPYRNKTPKFVHSRWGWLRFELLKRGCTNSGGFGVRWYTGCRGPEQKNVVHVFYNC